MTTDEKLDLLIRKVGSMDERMDSWGERMDSMGERIDSMATNMEKMQGNINALKTGQQRIRQEVRIVSDKVAETYALALENWGEVEESKVRLTALES